MTNEEKIVAILEKQGKTLENLQADVKDLKHGQQEQGAAIARVEQGQSRTNTVLKVLEAGQNDIRENMATKADVQDVKAEQAKHKRRIENVEENTKTPNPEKH